MRRLVALGLRSASRELASATASATEAAGARAAAATIAASSSIVGASSPRLRSLSSSLFRRRPGDAPAPPPLLLYQRRSMFVQTQSTPNPASLMFIPGEPVLPPGAGGVTFSSARDARGGDGAPSSPLASAIFRVDGVSAVFFGSDFITVTKKEDYAWELVKPGVFEAIMEHYSTGKPALVDGRATAPGATPGSSASSNEPHRAPDTAPHEDDSETVAMIKELIETRVRPAVQEDGGDIEFVRFDEGDGVVTVRMRGACSGCPSSAVTLKSGIENMLMHYVPEVTAVEEAEGEDDEVKTESEKAFSRLEKHLST